MPAYGVKHTFAHIAVDYTIISETKKKNILTRSSQSEIRFTKTNNQITGLVGAGLSVETNIFSGLLHPRTEDQQSLHGVILNVCI